MFKLIKNNMRLRSENRELKAKLETTIDENIKLMSEIVECRNKLLSIINNQPITIKNPLPKEPVETKARKKRRIEYFNQELKECESQEEK